MFDEHDGAPFGWMGGKGRMAPLIAPLIPVAETYVEAYGGVATLLFCRPPSTIEVYNDVAHYLVNFFRILQNDASRKRLIERLAGTLYSRAEFALAIETLERPEYSDEEKAWAIYVCQNQGMGGRPPPHTVGGWGRSIHGPTNVAATWWNKMGRLEAYGQRFRSVQIEQRDAIEVIRQWDHPNCVIYVDPPYVSDTRRTKVLYDFEPDNAYHERLVETLLNAQGAVALSGYPSVIYRRLEERGWDYRLFDAICSGAGHVKGSNLQGAGALLEHQRRTEGLWRNRRCLEMLNDGIGLFDSLEIDKK